LKNLRERNVQLFLVLFITSCQPFDRGFEFVGEYAAARSKYRMHIVAGGNIKGGHDISDTAFSLVRICPFTSRSGTPFDMTLISDPEGRFLVESKDLKQEPSEWTWRTAAPILRQMLGRAGFINVTDQDLKGSIQAIEGSLAGPKGSVLKGQSDSLDVLQAKTEYLSMKKRGRPDFSWVKHLSLKPCEEDGAQPAAAPDASRR